MMEQLSEPNPELDAIVKSSYETNDIKGFYESIVTRKVESIETEIQWLGPKFTAEFISRHVPKDVRILDLGAGTGLLAEELRSLGYNNIDGLDGCEKMLDVAKKHNRYSNYFVEMVYLNQPCCIADETYDCIAAVGIITKNHLTPEFFPQILKMLKPGGYFVMLTKWDNALLLRDVAANEEIFQEKMDILALIKGKLPGVYSPATIRTDNSSKLLKHLDMAYDFEPYHQYTSF